MTIGIWGDSITYGSCDEEALGWAGRLRKTLPTNDYHQLYNFGICGETTDDLLKRFKIEAQAINPDKIVFAIGINDLKFPKNSEINKVAIEIFRNNLEELLKQACQYTDDITLIGLTKVGDEWKTAKGKQSLNEEIKKYDTVIQEIAEENKYLYISIFDTIVTSIDLADGIHPNTNGYQKMFEIIKSKLTL